MIKRISALILVAIMTFSLAACGGDSNEVSSTASDSQVVAEVESAAQNEDAQDASKQETTASKDNTSEGAKSETATTSSKLTTASKLTGAVSGGNKVTVKDDGTSIKPIKNLKVNSGESISQNIDLKGKKITMAITEEGQYNTAAFKRCVSAFEIAYNCKVTIKKLSFGTYNQQVGQAKAAGDMYDICYVHGSFFPALAIDDIYEPVNDYLYEGDVATSSTSGGIDLNKTSYFVYKNKIYGTCNFNSAFPYLIYYNKKMLADQGYSGANDPRKLAERGKWTWKTIQNMGKRLSNAKEGKFFLSGSFAVGRAIPLSFGAQIVVYDEKSGKYKENITSKEFISALKFKQELGVGSNAILDPKSRIDYLELTSGDVYMWSEESSKYIDLVPAVQKSSSFGKDKKNIGIVEMPLGGTNKNRYPTGWLTAVACGKGKDPRVSIAWDVFRSKYVDPNASKDVTAFSAEDDKYIDSLLVGDIALDIGRFYSSDTDTEALVYNTGVDPHVRNGASIDKEIASYKDQVQACINYATRK